MDCLERTLSDAPSAKFLSLSCVAFETSRSSLSVIRAIAKSQFPNLSLCEHHGALDCRSIAVAAEPNLRKPTCNSSVMTRIRQLGGI